MKEFSMRTKIYMGESSIEAIKEIPMNRVFIICDPFMVQSKKIELVTDILEEKNIPFEVFSEVVPDPTIDVVTGAVYKITDFDADTVIALGGGSAIDTAKSVCKVNNKMGLTKVSLIAIPTTSGTGSEVTSFSVISDPETKSKFPIVDEDMIPDIAVLDSTLTMSVPAKITADTGMDVLTHAFEALVSTNANDFSDAYAHMAIKLVFKYLETAVKHGDDEQARTHMHNASCMAGIAFNSASLGICHSMAHVLGGYFHIPHGRSNAMLLPHVIEYNARHERNVENTALSKYADAGRMLGFGTVSDITTVKSLVRHVKMLMKRIGISPYVNEMVEMDKYSEAVEDMARRALVDKCTLTNPKEPSVEDIKEIYGMLVKNWNK